MKKLLLFVCFIFTFSAYSQEDAWVYFTDKPNFQSYFDNPLTMLTQRSLDRRINQNIALDITDVPLHQPYVDQITNAVGIVVKAKSKWLNSVHIRGSISDINALLSFAFVDHIRFANTSLNTGGRNSYNKKEKGLNKVLETNTNFAYGTSANQIQMLNGHLVHQQGYTGTGKIIAVLDAGFPNVDVILPFQRLRDNNQILGGYNFVDDNNNFYTGNAHGTIVLSTMGGYVENQLIGTAPDAKYYLFITEDSADENPVEESYWVEGAEEADRLGADVITSSLGYFDYPNYPSYSHTYSEMTGNLAYASQGANIAFSKGMIVVAAAGNTGTSLTAPYVGVPAEATNVLAVGAVKADETYATFSSIGPSFDQRVKPDVMAQGENSVASNSAGGITTISGTSISCPILAGMIASFWQAFPNLTNQQIVDLVKQSSDRFSNPTAQLGYGIPDFQLAITNGLLQINSNTKYNFVVFPNPVNQYLSISFPDNFSNAKFSLFNNLGQLVLENDSLQQHGVVSLERLNLGMYFYKIESGSYTQTGKIIKN